LLTPPVPTATATQESVRAQKRRLCFRRLSIIAAGTRKAYQDFLALWKDADADLPILIEAKKEYAALK
jgi:hypothetical protein